MIHALLQGKLSRQQQNMEDILTSNVFGLLRYIPPQSRLLPFLAEATASDGLKPLRFLVAPPFTSDVSVNFEFWPYLSEEGCRRCEPDLLLTIYAQSKTPVIVAIEAKYLSGKSSETSDEAEIPSDQLAREWDNLDRRASRLGSRAFLIYLTQDFSYPADEIEASVNEWQLKRAMQSARAPILWLSWRSLSLARKREGFIEGDLAALLGRLNLTRFDGFSVNACPRIQWTFSKVSYHWAVNPPGITWRFIDERN